MKMKWNKWLNVALSIFILLIALACGSQYSNLPSTVQDCDLVGTWEAHYNKQRIDTLVLRGDGTFKQTYRDDTVNGYIYETSWNEWWVERFSDGRVRIHLQGARIYKEGIRIAELDGMGSPCPEELPDCYSGHNPRSFYDPIADESMYMVEELVLNIQNDSSGEPVLLHMLLSKDQGFVSITGKATGFNRIEIQSPLQTPTAP